MTLGSTCYPNPSQSHQKTTIHR